MKTKSVSSKPIWPPKPAPPVAIAVGADQEPSGRRATTRPEPNRAEPRKPAFMTVRIARPCRRKKKLLVESWWFRGLATYGFGARKDLPLLRLGRLVE